jgi:hypothetical protein
VAGRFLNRDDGPARLTGRQADTVSVPIIASSRPAVDDQLVVKVDSLPSGAAEAILAGGTRDATRATILAMDGTPVGEAKVDSAHLLTQWLTQVATTPPIVDGYWTSGQVTYTEPSPAHLAPEPVTVPQSTWGSEFGSGTGGFVAVPSDAADTSFRTLTAHKLINSARTHKLINSAPTPDGLAGTSCLWSGTGSWGLACPEPRTSVPS